MTMWPVGSSASYAQWGESGTYGFHRIPRDQVRAGDIVIWDKYGDPLASYGDRGHTAVFDHMAGGMWVCMESYGGHGVGYKARAADWWLWVVRVGDGADQSELNAMHAWMDVYADKVPYYSGAADSNNDRTPDRAEPQDQDGNGMDCSGTVWQLWNQASLNPIAAPVPPPPTTTPMELPMHGSTYYDHSVHSFWIDGDGFLQHSWGRGNHENMSHAYLGDLKLIPDQGVVAYVQPDSLGALLQVSAIQADGRNRRLQHTLGHGWDTWQAPA